MRTLEDMPWNAVVHDRTDKLPAGVSVLVQHVDGAMSLCHSDRIRAEGWGFLVLSGGTWPEKWLEVDGVYEASEIPGFEEQMAQAEEGDGSPWREDQVLPQDEDEDEE